MTEPFEVPAALPLEQQQGQTFCSLVALMRRLLGPGGCPWDQEQDALSLRRFVLEEACEVIDAIDSGQAAAVAEELGDLALQVVFLAELGRDSGDFGPDDVIRGICEKLVRRHPHVFGEVTVSGSQEVLTNWDAIKRQEKGERGLLERIPRSLPALLRATQIGQKVSNVGFDWPEPAGSKAKVDEELVELAEAVASGERAAIEAEYGDLLFALVNYSRHLGLDAETALRKASDRFTARFGHVETRVRETHGAWPKPDEPKLALDELDKYWNEAKKAGL